MGRKTNKKVDEYRDRVAGVISIYLTPDNTFVTDEVYGKTVAGESIATVLRALLDHLRDNNTLEFNPVICIEEIKPHGYQDTFIGVQAHRFLWARNAAGTLLKLDWRDKDKYDRGEPVINLTQVFRIRTGYFDPPVVIDGSFGSKEVYVPYTDEAWAGVISLQETIVRARERLNNILYATDIQTTLEKVARGTNLLGSGE
jgi:hypothetical protein